MNNLLIKLVIFSVVADKLKVFAPRGILPSRAIERGRPLDEIAKDLFKTTLNISTSNYYFEQLYTFSGKNGIAVSYYVLLPYFQLPKATIKSWYEYQRLKPEIRDWEIMTYAVKRLRWKIEYTNIVYSLLPPEFIFSQLQTTYEAILGKNLDKRNFRKKLLSLAILKDTGKKKYIGKARPAEVFAFKKRQLSFVEIL